MLDTPAPNAERDAQKRAADYQALVQTGAIGATPRSVAEIAKLAGWVPADSKVTNTHRRRVLDALQDRDEVVQTTRIIRGQPTSLYHRHWREAAEVFAKGQ